MKKVFVFSILVLFLGSLFALESGPSDVLGFVKITAPSNFYTALALPLEVDGQMASTVFADGAGVPYITGGPNPVFSDQIIQMGGGGAAWYNSGTSTWIGDFAVDVTRAYYAVIRAAHSAADIYICGTVDNTTVVNYAVIPANFYSEIGFREAGATVMTSNIGLLTAGFQGGVNPVFSDQIIQIGGGGAAWYNTGTSTWIGDFALTPGKAYYLVIRNGHTGLAAYSYPASGSDGGFPTLRERSPIVPTSRKSTDKITNKIIREKK